MTWGGKTTSGVSQEIRPWSLAITYSLMLFATVGLFFVIRWFGESPSVSVITTETVKSAHAQRSAPKAETLPHVLGALTAIIISGRGLGAIFARLGQPRVIGEVLAGISLGPSVLGRISPEAMSLILPTSVAPFLGLIAQLGVILYMFLVGLELNLDLIRSRVHTTVAISHASIVAPFLLGATLSLWLYSSMAPPGVPFTSFALFMGVAMSITAFPVLARILTDRGIERTELGVVALSCAAADDVTAWCLLAFVVGVTQSEISGAMTTFLLTGGYIALVIGVVRPFASGRLGALSETQVSSKVIAWVLVALLVSSLATEAIGIHAIFGAFLIGAVFPHDSAIARVIRQKLEDVVTILLLPAFFAFTGMRTQIGLVSGPAEWLICGLIVAVATLGKFGGTTLAARFTGLSWRASSSLGILMNTRGLMELIVLNIGLDLGIISPTLFAMMVLMALITTVATTPILQLLNPDTSMRG